VDRWESFVEVEVILEESREQILEN